MNFGDYQVKARKFAPYENPFTTDSIVEQPLVNSIVALNQSSVDTLGKLIDILNLGGELTNDNVLEIIKDLGRVLFAVNTVASELNISMEEIARFSLIRLDKEHGVTYDPNAF